MHPIRVMRGRLLCRADVLLDAFQVALLLIECFTITSSPQADSVKNHCVEASTSFGSLIHETTGITGGTGGLRPRCSRITSARASSTLNVTNVGPMNVGPRLPSSHLDRGVAVSE
jgi:hypothetical protein